MPMNFIMATTAKASNNVKRIAPSKRNTTDLLYLPVSIYNENVVRRRKRRVMNDIRNFLEQHKDQLWTQTDIANYHMVSQQRIANWIRRYDDFPEPVIKRGRLSIYLRSEIKDFIKSKKFKSVRKEYWEGISQI